MSSVFWIFGALALLLAGLTWIAAGAGARYMVRVAAVAAFIVALGVALIGVLELMGRPKPMSQAWFEKSKGDARVLSIQLEPDEAIYFWLMFPGETEPRAYQLPWSRLTAEKIDDAMSRAGSRNEQVELAGPMSKWSLYGDGELPIRIIAPPNPRRKSLPNRPRKVEPGKQPI